MGCRAGSLAGAVIAPAALPAGGCRAASPVSRAKLINDTSYPDTCSRLMCRGSGTPCVVALVGMTPAPQQPGHKPGALTPLGENAALWLKIGTITR